MKVEMTDVFFITRTIFSRASSSRPAVRAAPRTRAFPGTMASEISRELAPLVKRADEIQAHHPLMAYYCACPLVARRNVFSRRAVSTTPRLSPAPHIRTRARDAPLTRARVSCSLAKCFRPHARG